MTNPGNAIGTNAAYNGRTSVNAFNDVLAALSRGVVSGWECKPGTGMTVTLGGNGTTRDVAVAEDNAGNKTTINNISSSPISVTIAAAPGANSRIDAIVGYVDDSAKGSGNADNPECCGIIAVSGTAASSPSAPADSAIRSAITSDGANGTSAYYVVLATVRVTASLTTITQQNIIAMPKSTVGSKNIGWSTIDVDISSISGTNVKTYTPNFFGFVCITGYFSRPSKKQNSKLNVMVKVDGVTLYSENSDNANPVYSNYRVRNFSYSIPAIPGKQIEVTCSDSDGTKITPEQFSASKVEWK